MAAEESLEELIKYYADVESQGESILVNKQQLIELDAQRNRNREALRQLKKMGSSGKGLPQKSWMCFNDTFIKLDTQLSMDVLQGDQKNIDDEIDRLHTEMKTKVSKLNEMEGTAKSKGFDLKGISVKEVSNITGSS